MGTLTIRNLPDEIIQAVKSAAEIHQHSMEQEVRELLQLRYGPRSDILRRIRERWETLPHTKVDEVNKWRQTGRR